MNRRDFLAGSGFTASAFTTPVARRLVTPADETAARRGGQQVGRADLNELREAAGDARRWDSKYGGGNWKANSVTDCLHRRAAPLLEGSFSDEVGRELFFFTAQLSRLAGWTAFDVSQHDAAHMQSLMRGSIRSHRHDTGRLQAGQTPGSAAGADVHQADRGPRARPGEQPEGRLLPGPGSLRGFPGQGKGEASGDEPAWIDF